MADTSRIEELRRRVQRDPASIAFAQLAEEYRRAGRYREAIETCEDGLLHHPGYLSARVTLGRALIETGQLDVAQLELKQVLRAAPENLAALRGLAEVHHRRGELREALAHYRTALEFARHDPELEHLVEQIQQELEPHKSGPVVVDGMSFDEVKETFLNLSLPDAEEGSDPAFADEPEAAQPEEDHVDAPSMPVPDLPDAAGNVGPQVDDPIAPVHEAAAPEQDAAVPLEEVVVIGGEPAGVADEHGYPMGEGPKATGEDAPQLPGGFDAAGAHPVTADAEETSGGEAPATDTESVETLAPSVTSVLELPAPVEEPVVDEPVSEPLLLGEGQAIEPAAAPAAPSSSHQVDALERWLEVILADRQRRR